MSLTLVGFDPGGSNAFGWAVMDSEDQDLSLIRSGTCSSAPQALAAVLRNLTNPPAAIGIDAPLFWVAEGDRAADRTVRSLVLAAGGQAGTVSHVNSLRGACLVQGVLIATLAHSQWPVARVTEAHPKALIAVSSAARSIVERLGSTVGSEHERDAVLAAFSAFAFATRTDGWHDLAAREPKPIYPAGFEVGYWFPKARC